MPSVIFRKGLNLQHAVAGRLADDYHSAAIEQIQASGYTYRSGRLTVRLAREFGFCYGVDRAVDYAYQTRLKFPDRSVYLTGEIIHNPHVNEKLRAAGIQFLSDPDAHPDRLGAEAVVILPAFGVTIGELERYERQGCTLVDTTCGSVLNVWKNVKQYARDGFTAVIHGKVHHEETQATASQALRYPNGRYLVLLDRAAAVTVCDYLRGRTDAAVILERFKNATSVDFDPERDLQRIGLANQTTMLMSESLEIGELFRQAMIDRYGEHELADRFRAFDTICSATQDRQDAVETLLGEHRFDLMIVVGGYNSSNTRNLARICVPRVRTYHIADAECVMSPTELRHRPVDMNRRGPNALVSGTDEDIARGWLPPSGPVTIGLTAGASTPNSIIGPVIERLGQCTAEAP